MKRMLIAAVLAFAAGGQALAADLPQAPPPPPRAPATYVPIVAPVYNWSGVYVGINGGYGFGTAKWTGPLPGGIASGTLRDNGGFVGGTLGVNFQAGAFVFGVESDLDWSGINSTNSSTFCNVTGNCQTGNNWLGTARGRIGVAADRVLFYGTGGGVFGDIKTTYGSFTNTTTQVGWTAGVGIEVAFAENWTGKIEYLYANLGTGTCNTVCTNAGATGPISVGLVDNLIRAGINFKFGP